MKLPWGKFKGVEIEDVPSGYLKWLAENCEDDAVCTAADGEYRWRSDFNLHFSEFNQKTIEKRAGVEIDKIVKDMREERVFDKRERYKIKEDEMNELDNQLQVKVGINQAPLVQQPLPTAPVVNGPAGLELRASLEVAKVAGNPALLGLIQRGTQLAQWKNFKLIENQVQYDQAIDAFTKAKEVLNELEKLRHSVVDFPTKVVSLVNALFKSVRDGVEGCKGHIGGIINVKKQADLAAAQRAQTQAQIEQEEKINQIPQVVEDATGQDVVQFEPPPVEVPSNVVESAKGAKVHTRVDTEVEIVNLEAFLKVVVSSNKRNVWLNEKMDELVTVHTNVLKKLITENKKRTVNGVRIEKVRRTV